MREDRRRVRRRDRDLDQAEEARLGELPAALLAADQLHQDAVGVLDGPAALVRVLQRSRVAPRRVEADVAVPLERVRNLGRLVRVVLVDLVDDGVLRVAER